MLGLCMSLVCNFWVREVCLACAKYVKSVWVGRDNILWMPFHSIAEFHIWSSSSRFPMHTYCTVSHCLKWHHFALHCKEYMTIGKESSIYLIIFDVDLTWIESTTQSRQRRSSYARSIEHLFGIEKESTSSYLISIRIREFELMVVAQIQQQMWVGWNTMNSFRKLVLYFVKISIFWKSTWKKVKGQESKDRIEFNKYIKNNKILWKQ